MSGPGGGVWSEGGVWSGGSGLVPGGGLVRGGGSAGQEPPPVNRMTNRCKNITLAKTSFRAGNYCHIV